MDTFPHITHKRERRICIRIDSRPNPRLLQILKTYGRHRTVGDGQARAWHFRPDVWDSLHACLLAGGYNALAAGLQEAMAKWRQNDAES